MKVIKSKRGIALLAVLVVAAIAAFGAYAYWTTTGNGTGSATTGTDHGVTVNQTSPSSGLYPGGSVALSGDFTSNARQQRQRLGHVGLGVDRPVQCSGQPVEAGVHRR